MGDRQSSGDNQGGPMDWLPVSAASASPAMQTHDTRPAGFQPAASAPKAKPLPPPSFEVVEPGRGSANPFPPRPHEVWTAEPAAAVPLHLPQQQAAEGHSDQTQPATPLVQRSAIAAPETAQEPASVDRDWIKHHFRMNAPGTPPSPPPYNSGIVTRVPREPVTPEPYWYQGPPVQAKLTVGAANDAYEQEADQVAAHVMAMPEPTAKVQRQTEVANAEATNIEAADVEDSEATPALQSKPLAATITPLVQRQELPDSEESLQLKCAACEPEDPIQRTATGVPQVQPDLESRLSASQSGGNPLSDEVLGFMEPRFGADFSQVRVHTGSDAVQMNQELGAQAFTHGAHIYYGAGKAPAKDELTGHELTHVVQQTGTSAHTNLKRQTITSYASRPDRIQCSPLSDELRRLWDPNNKSPFFTRLRAVGVSDPDVLAFARTLTGDDRFLAENIALHGPNENRWPIDQQVRLVMKPWYWGRVGKGTVFDILRTANGREANNASLTAALADIFDPASEDLWYGQNLQIYGTENGQHLRFDGNGSESNWPSDAQEHWRNARTARTAAPGQRPPGTHWPAGGVPPELLAGTHTPTAADRTAITQSLTPIGGVAPTFQPNHPNHGNYEARMRQKITQWINLLYARTVVGRGRTEHEDLANLHPMSRFQEIGNVAKREVDAVFGSYASGPAFVAGTNLFDRWQSYDEETWGTPDPNTGVRTGGLSNADQIETAKALVSYAIGADDAFRTINQEHSAITTRTTPPPAGGEAEATIIDRICNHFATTQTTRLLEIDRAWPATAGGGIVSIQIWRDSTDAGNRRIFWDAFQTMIHEYLHTLAHPSYVSYYDRNHGGRYAYGSDEQNTLEEGVDSLLTETVWANVSGRVSDPALRQAIEGTTYAAQPFTPSVIPSIEEQRYSSYAQARSLVNVVGINNLYAAYFLGQVDLIRGT